MIEDAEFEVINRWRDVSAEAAEEYDANEPTGKTLGDSSAPPNAVRALPQLQRFQDNAFNKSGLAESVRAMSFLAPPVTALPPQDAQKFDALIRLCKIQFDSPDPPSSPEIRRLLSEVLVKVSIELENRQAYDYATTYGIVETQTGVIEGLNNALGNASQKIDTIKAEWLQQYRAEKYPPLQNDAVEASWLLVDYAALVNLNIQRMCKELCLAGEICPDELRTIEGINFFSEAQADHARDVWEMIVAKQFPLQVFSLEPQIEEQNLFDATSQRRAMQMALAVGVAASPWNLRQKVALSRQLENDAATISLNRVAVGFNHGSDTFGWYFYPRFQPPRTNVSGTCFLSARPVAPIPPQPR